MHKYAHILQKNFQNFNHFFFFLFSLRACHVFTVFNRYLDTQIHNI